MLGWRLVVADGRCAAAVVVATVHALHCLVVRGQSSDDRVAGQRVGVILSRVLLVPPTLNCTGNTQNSDNIITVLDIMVVGGSANGGLTA